MRKNQNKVDGMLVLRYQTGDTTALPLLVKRWHKKFCNKAFWTVKDADIAKDIAQDSWKTIIEKINNLKDVNSFGTWASRIVYTKSLDWLRASKKERENLQEYRKDHLIVDNKPVVDVQLQKSILKAVKLLPDTQQHVIKLFYVEDYTLKEIGEILDISVGTAKSRLFHAREKLKQKLNDKKRHY
jgi:RNA polymerase sigma-70 factor (ECF subfamily)